MGTWLLIIAAVVISFIILYQFVRTPVGTPMRLVPGNGQIPVAESAFIEANKQDPVFSCSFVEFDGRGDFIDFAQHSDCLSRLKTLAEQQPLLLVMYCHGWKNNSQSSDVVRFNAFLARLARARTVCERGLRVHGVFLSWRGNQFKPFVARDREFDAATAAFGAEIVAKKHSRKFRLTWAIPETLSYWFRKRAAEHQVSGLSITRAIFTYAGLARNTSRDGAGRTMDNGVFVIGHSFGGLMLEQSLLQGVVGSLTSQWTWYGQGVANAEGGRLPFDLILLVNSAAPSIYAKQLRGFLSAHFKALEDAEAPHADAPVVVSVTSTADAATRVAHRIANCLARWRPSMQRSYSRRLLKTKQRGAEHLPVHQSEFYKRTPGHNPMLVNRWAVEQGATAEPMTGDDVIAANLDPDVLDPLTFFVRGTAATASSSWRLVDENPAAEPPQINGVEADPWTKSVYWLVECDKRLIKDHGDVWNERAMDLYAALYRCSEVLKRR